MDKTAIRNAATTILIRDRDDNPSVLMGQRGASAAFMPNKFVFPGGATDPGDLEIPLIRALDDPCQSRLLHETEPKIATALPITAIRELWEETGLALGRTSQWSAPPPDWTGFAGTGLRPSAEHLRFVFRAITPPGRPRRFDARFFLADAANIPTDIDDFSEASDELSHLQWIPLSEVRQFDLPFITQVVLAEVARNLRHPGPPQTVPFFKNNDEETLFRQIGTPAD